MVGAWPAWYHVRMESGDEILTVDTERMQQHDARAPANIQSVRHHGMPADPGRALLAEYPAVVPSNFPFYYLDALTNKWCGRGCCGGRTCRTGAAPTRARPPTAAPLLCRSNRAGTASSCTPACGMVVAVPHALTLPATRCCGPASCRCRPARSCSAPPSPRTHPLQLRNRRPLERISGHATYAQYRKLEPGAPAPVVREGRPSSAAVVIDGVTFLQSDRPFARATPARRPASKVHSHLDLVSVTWCRRRRQAVTRIRRPSVLLVPRRGNRRPSPSPSPSTALPRGRQSRHVRAGAGGVTWSGGCGGGAGAGRGVRCGAAGC